MQEAVREERNKGVDEAVRDQTGAMIQQDTLHTIPSHSTEVTQLRYLPTSSAVTVQMDLFVLPLKGIPFESCSPCKEDTPGTSFPEYPSLTVDYKWHRVSSNKQQRAPNLELFNILKRESSCPTQRHKWTFLGNSF